MDGELCTVTSNLKIFSSPKITAWDWVTLECQQLYSSKNCRIFLWPRFCNAVSFFMSFAMGKGGKFPVSRWNIEYTYESAYGLNYRLQYPFSGIQVTLPLISTIAIKLHFQKGKYIFAVENIIWAGCGIPCVSFAVLQHTCRLEQAQWHTWHQKCVKRRTTLLKLIFGLWVLRSTNWQHSICLWEFEIFLNTNDWSSPSKREVTYISLEFSL